MSHGNGNRRAGCKYILTGLGNEISFWKVCSRMIMGAYEITSRANTVQGGRFSLRPGGFDRTASTISAVGESLLKVVSTGSVIAAAAIFLRERKISHRD